MKIQAGEVTQYLDQDSGNTFQAVPWTITDDSGAVLFQATQSFDLSATVDEITAFLAQTLAVHQEDMARAEDSQALQVDLDNAVEVASQVSNIVINSQ